MPRSPGNPLSEALFWNTIAALKKDIDRLQLQVLDDASNLTTPMDLVTITTSGYSEVFTIAAGTATTVSVMFSADADAGSTNGEVRAIDVTTGAEVHAPVAVTLGTGHLIWDMDLPPSADDWRLIEIQARRNTGTGSLKFRPYGSKGG
jgi:hypothetical protein